MKSLFIIALLILTLSACQTKETKQSTVIQNTAIKICTKDAKICPDGRSVGRNPNNNCEFDACDRKAIKQRKVKSMMCTADVKECPDGLFVSRDHYNQCKFKDCPPTKNGRD